MENAIYEPTSRDQYNAQGKSNSFINAQNAGRLTAGQAAKTLTKRFGFKVLARDVEPFAIEYHHAGRFGRNMAKRVFFFTEEQLDAITPEMLAASVAVPGWVLGFDSDLRGRNGRRRWLPKVAEVGMIDAARVRRLGDKFHPIPVDELEEAKASIGKRLPPFSGDWREAL